MFDKPRHESGVGDPVWSNSAAAKGVKEHQGSVEVPTSAEGAEDDVVSLEVGGNAAPEGAMGKGREERVSVGEATGPHESVEEGVMGADARVAAEEGREAAEGGKRGVGHERAGEGGECNSSHISTQTLDLWKRFTSSISSFHLYSAPLPFTVTNKQKGDIR